MARKKKKKAGSAPAAEIAPAPRPAPPARKGSPLVTVLTVLLILVGIADLFLWGLAGYYLLQSTRSQPSGGDVQSVPAGGTTAQSPSAGGTAPQSAPAAAGTSPQSTPAGGAASPAPPTPGGGDDAAAREALEAYIQSVSTIVTLEDQVQASFGSVSGTNFTDDPTMYTEITENTVPLCQQLNEAVLAINPSDPEIAQAHEIYRDYVTSYLNALTMLSSALSNQDVDQVTRANEMINATNDLANDFQQALQTLASQRGVTLNN